ncbi:NACHT domain-containing protein, partial [bacterium]
MKFDLLSFLLGFFGGLVVLVIRRFFKGVLPKIFNSASNWVLNYKQKNLNVIEDQFKSATYQRAQNAHLQNNLFPLKEIIVPPFFTAPPKNKLNHASEPIYSVTDRLFPFTPGYLELASQFSISKISLSDAIANGVNLVLIGHPGSGKTTALADLVSQICSCPQKTGQLAAFFPIYMHVHDIILSNDDSNSWNLLLDSLQGLNTAHRNQINKLLLNIKNVFSRKILFVLDGMDELSPQDFDQYTKLLKRLLDDYPAIQVLTTATPEYLGNLLDLGFSPLGITAWGRREIDHFLKNWITQWDRN